MYNESPILVFKVLSLQPIHYVLWTISQVPIEVKDANSDKMTSLEQEKKHLQSALAQLGNIEQN